MLPTRDIGEHDPLWSVLSSRPDRDTTTDKEGTLWLRPSALNKTPNAGTFMPPDRVTLAVVPLRFGVRAVTLRVNPGRIEGNSGRVGVAGHGLSCHPCGGGELCH